MSVYVKSSVVLFVPFTQYIFVFCNLEKESLIHYIAYYYRLPGRLKFKFGIELEKADGSSVNESLF